MLIETAGCHSVEDHNLNYHRHEKSSYIKDFTVFSLFFCYRSFMTFPFPSRRFSPRNINIVYSNNNNWSSKCIPPWKSKTSDFLSCFLIFGYMTWHFYKNVHRPLSKPTEQRVIFHAMILKLSDAQHRKVFWTISVSRLTLRRLMSYIYGAPILDVSRSHTTTQHSR